jgi:hypothetical protein
MLFCSSAYSTLIVVDVDNYDIIDIGGGFFVTRWFIPESGISQLEPNGTYSLNIEFQTDQSFFVEPLQGYFVEPFQDYEQVQLVFGAPVIGVNPNLQLSYGTANFTGVDGDFDGSSPENITGVNYIPNILPGIEAVILSLNSDLTSEGFSFHDIHFDFGFGSQGTSYAVGSRGVFLQVTGFEAVPVPATLALFGLGLAGLGWSRRKKS